MKHPIYDTHRAKCASLIVNIEREGFNIKKRLQQMPCTLPKEVSADEDDPREAAKDYAFRVSASFDDQTSVDMRLTKVPVKAILVPAQKRTTDAVTASGSGLSRGKTVQPPAPPSRTSERRRSADDQSYATSRASSVDSTHGRSGRAPKRPRAESDWNRGEEKDYYRSYSSWKDRDNEWGSSRGSSYHDYRESDWWSSWKK